MAAKESPKAGSAARGAEITTPDNCSADPAAVKTAEKLNTIFAPLADRAMWITWQRVERDNGKTDKIPTNDGMHKISYLDADNLSPLNKSLKNAKAHSLGVGIVLNGPTTEDDCILLGIDIDKANLEHPDLKKLLFILGTYAELSPSEKGVHAYAWIPATWFDAYRDSVAKDLTFADHIELYIGTSPRFLTVTFNPIQALPIQKLDAQALNWLEPWFKPKEKPQATSAPLTPGQVLDLDAYTLNDQQRAFYEGRWEGMDRSAVLHGLLISLMDQGASQEAALATMTGCETLWTYCLDHRNGSQERAQKFASDEVGRAWRNTLRGRQTALQAFNEGWAEPAPEKDEPRAKNNDDELAWIIEHLPPVQRAFFNWYQANAIRPHPVFALVCSFAFAQCVTGRNYALPNGLRANLWMLLLAPTESGKGDVERLLSTALEQLKAAGAMPAIARPENSFGSAEAFYWYMQEAEQCLLFDEELGKSLAMLNAASEGTPRFAMRRELLKLHDAASKAEVPPIRYSKRNSAAREMKPLHYPFLSIVGTGVPRDVESFTAAASQDGLLNRFLPIVIDTLPKIGTLRAPQPLPATVVEWARRNYHRSITHALLSTEPRVVEAYPEFDHDWEMLAEEGAQKAQNLPGVWGRFAAKVLKVALLRAAFEDGGITPEGFEWASRVTRWAVTAFATHFAAQGGGAENEFDALRNAFLSVFESPSLAGKDVIPATLFAKYSRQWKSTPARQRGEVIRTLVEDGAIELVDLKPKGIGYRRHK